MNRLNLKKLLTIATAVSMLTLLNACSTTSSNEEFSKLSRQEQIAQLNNINELEENGKIALISRYKKARFAVNCTYHYKKKIDIIYALLKEGEPTLSTSNTKTIEELEAYE